MTAPVPPKPKQFPFQKMVPNMMTITAMCAGMSSIQFAISERWEAAVLAIVAAAFIDGFDGAVARLLKASSKFGAELDSLSDFLCFGVTPAIVMYLWVLNDAGRLGWMVSLVYCVAVSLRLARFNSTSKQHDKDASPLEQYFTGVPSPTGAGLAVLPMIICFQLDPSTADLIRQPALIGFWLLLMATLMVSRVPTFSSKQINLPNNVFVPMLAGFGCLAAGLINAPWPTLTLIALGYAASIPWCMWHYRQTKKRLKKDAGR